MITVALGMATHSGAVVLEDCVCLPACLPAGEGSFRPVGHIFSSMLILAGSSLLGETEESLQHQATCYSKILYLCPIVSYESEGNLRHKGQRDFLD